MASKTIFKLSILLMCFLLNSCMLATWTVAYSHPETRVMLAGSSRICSSQLISSPEDYSGKIVSVSGRVTSKSDDFYVISNAVYVSSAKLDWPLFVGDEVLIKGKVYLKGDRITLKYPFLENSPERTPEQVISDSQSYHMKFVNISGIVTDDQGQYFTLEDRIRVDYKSNRIPRPAVGQFVELRGQLLASPFTGGGIKLGSVDTIGR